MYEISSDANLPPRVYACGMMMYHAFMEYIFGENPGEDFKDPDCVIVGITCLILSVKFNEDYLNSVEVVTDAAPIKSRSIRIIDSAARAILSYGGSVSNLSTEQLIGVKDKLKSAVCEMSILRILGNFATSIPLDSRIDSMSIDELIETYSTPHCLTVWANRKNSA
jgi:hypothetical protein